MIHRGSLTKARKRLVRHANRMISPLETLGGRRDAALPHRPLFVVGPPRSGTTLLVQVTAAAFDVCHFSNLLSACRGAPSWVARALRPLLQHPGEEFTSDLGTTRSWLGFSEGPEYWWRFFPQFPHCLATGDVPPRDLVRLRVAVRRLIRALDRPTIFKTIDNAGRLRPLAEALPEALFVVSRRDPLEAGHSLLEARLKRCGSYDEWLSFEPPGIAGLRSRPAHEQVIEQILRTYERIRSDAAAIGPDRFLEVDYTELCDDPWSVLERIGTFASLTPRSGPARPRIPARFGRRDEVRIPRELFRKMAEFCEERLASERGGDDFPVAARACGGES